MILATCRRSLAVVGVLCTLFAAATDTRADTPPAAPKAARSVHLGYPAAPADAFYNELTVRQSTPGSYFMACGFSHGYFGIQEQSNGKKVVLFSVWDAAKGNDPKAVKDEQRVAVPFQAEDVRVKRFGGEGTGGQCFFDYDWKIGDSYRFLVRADVSPNEPTETAYAAYFYLPEKKAWKHLVTFRTTTGGDKLKGLYSFLEDFRRDGKSATEVRRAVFSNLWICDSAGKWQPIITARFTASGADWEAKETIDAGRQDFAGIDTPGGFWLQTGGDTKTSTPLNSVIERPADGKAPADLPHD